MRRKEFLSERRKGEMESEVENGERKMESVKSCDKNFHTPKIEQAVYIAAKKLQIIHALFVDELSSV